MVHATWGDWFVREELEAVEPSGLSVWHLGCNGFALRTPETTVYVDLYFGDGNPPRLLRLPAAPMDPADATRCDAVLVTHEHRDHMYPPSYEPLVELGVDLQPRRPATRPPTARSGPTRTRSATGRSHPATGSPSAI
jgi:L-ascorbate 6-phosphate lactonase